MMKKPSPTGIAISLASALLASVAHSKPLDKGEYLVTVARPGSQLYIVDTTTDSLYKTCDLGVAPGPGSVVMSPDNHIAYVLSNRFGDVYGVELDTCETVFSTQQSGDGVRVKSLGSITVSPDGKYVYTHQNRVKIHSDRYELLAPQLAVFDISHGVNAKPVKTFDAPRQVTILDRLESGEVILAGPDIYQMDPETGAYKTILNSRSDDNPEYAPKDVLTVWPLGSINNEFIRLFSTARWGDEVGNLDTADWVWGYEKVDLKTGEAVSTVFGPLEVALFSGARRPQHTDKMYGVLNYLREYDITTQTELRSIPLEHSYYTLNFSRDGSKIYLLGADADIAVYDADTFTKLGNIPLGGDGSMANSVVFTR